MDIVSLCRCAQVAKYWNILALDGSNWQYIDLFSFQRDVEVGVFINTLQMFKICNSVIFLGSCS